MEMMHLWQSLSTSHFLCVCVCVYMYHISLKLAL